MLFFDQETAIIYQAMPAAGYAYAKVDEQLTIQNDAIYETLRVACFFAGVRGLALSEAMPKALPLVRGSVSPWEKIRL
ncbi:hypothetical protein [Nostoc sp.]|uniref:hypothetical protein n=1 Tax=Nostoc sp. TaxID=1180 RepID=UPI002FFAF46D